MKINLGHGAYMESDEGPRDTVYHKRIISTTRIAHTKTGKYCHLECGHRVMLFGKLQATKGVVLCTVCRDVETES
jgi:hypothetical protein